MASEVVYAEVSPKERVHFTSQTSDTVESTSAGNCGPHLLPSIVNCPDSSAAARERRCVQHNRDLITLGDPTTYAEVNVKWRPDRPDSTPKITHTATCLQNSPWCYVAVALYFTAVILLITVILLAVKCQHV